jgi:hypothetical protein
MPKIKSSRNNWSTREASGSLGHIKYKKSEEAKERSKKNKKNAAKKILHHRLGTCGYKTTIPKWYEAEAAMRSEWITPATDGWSKRTTS